MDDTTKVSLDGECSLVWEGSNPNLNSLANKRWKVADIRSEHEARRILQEKGYGHLWQHILQFNKMRAGEDTMN